MRGSETGREEGRERGKREGEGKVEICTAGCLFRIRISTVNMFPTLIITFVMQCFSLLQSPQGPSGSISFFYETKSVLHEHFPCNLLIHLLIQAKGGAHCRIMHIQSFAASNLRIVRNWTKHTNTDHFMIMQQTVQCEVAGQFMHTSSTLQLLKTTYWGFASRARTKCLSRVIILLGLISIMHLVYLHTQS